MLCSDLHDAIALQNRVARFLHFREHVAHGLFDVSVFAGFHCHFQNRRVRMFRSRNQHGVYVLQSQHVLEIFERTRSAAVIFRVRRGGLFAIVLPQIAHYGHLRVVARFQLRGDPIQITTAAARANVRQRDAIVRAHNSAVRKGRARQSSAGREQCGGLRQKFSAVDGCCCVVAHVWPPDAGPLRKIRAKRVPFCVPGRRLSIALSSNREPPKNLRTSGHPRLPPLAFVSCRQPRRAALTTQCRWS